MSDNKKKGLSSKFNSVAKGIVIGAAGAGVAAAILPVLTVSAPVLIIGGAIGGYFGYKNGKD